MYSTLPIELLHSHLQSSTVLSIFLFLHGERGSSSSNYIKRYRTDTHRLQHNASIVGRSQLSAIETSMCCSATRRNQSSQRTWRLRHSGRCISIFQTCLRTSAFLADYRCEDMIPSIARGWTWTGSLRRCYALCLVGSKCWYLLVPG